MKKFVFALAVLMLAAPAFARVDVSCTADGNEVTVSYDASTAPELVRAFALDITVDNGAKITAVSDVNAAYWVYPGSIVIEANGMPSDYGSAVADPCTYPALPGIGSYGATIEMGSLYVGEPNTPLVGGVLLKFAVDDDCTVTIAENAIRGGVVLEDPDLPADANCTGCTVAFTGCTCWGDVSGDGNVSAADLSTIIAYLHPVYKDTTPIPYTAPCMPEP